MEVIRFVPLNLKDGPCDGSCEFERRDYFFAPHYKYPFHYR